MIHSLKIEVTDGAYTEPHGSLYVKFDRFDGTHFAYKYRIQLGSDGETIAEGDDLRVAPTVGGSSDHIEAIVALIDFMLADGRRVAGYSGDAPLVDGFSFNRDTALWADYLDEELSLIRDQLRPEPAAGLNERQRHVVDHHQLEPAADGLFVASRPFGQIKTGDHVLVEEDGSVYWINVGRTPGPECNETDRCSGYIGTCSHGEPELADGEPVALADLDDDELRQRIVHYRDMLGNAKRANDRESYDAASGEYDAARREQRRRRELSGNVHATEGR